MDEFYLNNDKFTSSAYWTQLVQIQLYNSIKKYLTDNNMSQNEFAEKLGVSKGYVSQILNGDFDHKLSKLVELALACNLVPKVEFAPIEQAETVLKSTYQNDKKLNKVQQYNSKIRINRKEKNTPFAV